VKAGAKNERTGLHELTFIETGRHWFSSTVPHDTQGTVNVLNLIEGEHASVESPTGAFEASELHYAETVIIPAAVGPYTIRPLISGEANQNECATVKHLCDKPDESTGCVLGLGAERATKLKCLTSLSLQLRRYSACRFQKLPTSRLRTLRDEMMPDVSFLLMRRPVTTMNLHHHFLTLFAISERLPFGRVGDQAVWHRGGHWKLSAENGIVTHELNIY
jgi:hypothetical protein